MIYHSEMIQYDNPMVSKMIIMVYHVIPCKLQYVYEKLNKYLIQCKYQTKEYLHEVYVIL